MTPFPATMTPIPAVSVTQQKNRKANLDFHCPSDRMTVFSLLAKGDNNIIKQSDGSLRMPSHGLYRSKQPQQKTVPHDQRTRGRRVLPLSAIIMEKSHQSSVVSPKESSRHQSDQICGHHQIPYRYTQRHAECSTLAGANQNDSAIQSTSDSVRTFESFETISQNVLEARPTSCVHKLQPQDSLHNADTNSQSIKHSNSSQMNLSGAEQGFQMKRHGSHHFEEHSPSNSSLSVTSALRSRAITIHASKTIQSEDVDGLYTQETEKIYDQATWRMYNRIVDHRRNHQSNLSLATAQRQASAVSDEYLTLNTLQAVNSIHYDSLPDDNDDGVYSPADDGEIFELDL